MIALATTKAITRRTGTYGCSMMLRAGGGDVSRTK
jgi:hypothetical protein